MSGHDLGPICSSCPFVQLVLTHVFVRTRCRSERQVQIYSEAAGGWSYERFPFSEAALESVFEGKI